MIDPERLLMDPAVQKQLADKISHAIATFVREGLSTQIIQNLQPPMPPKKQSAAATKFTTLAAEAKIPLSTLADPVFQEAISKQISKDGKVDAKKLKITLNDYAKPPELTATPTHEPKQSKTTLDLGPVGESSTDYPTLTPEQRKKKGYITSILDNVGQISGNAHDLHDDERSHYEVMLRHVGSRDLSDPKIQAYITRLIFEDNTLGENRRLESGKINDVLSKPRLDLGHLGESSTDGPTPARKILVQPAEHPVDLTQNEPPVQEKKVEQKPSKTQTPETKTPISKTLAGKVLHAVKALAAFVKPKKNNKVAPAPFEKPKTDTKTR
jgi:hypothetical protein